MILSKMPDRLLVTWVSLSATRSQGTHTADLELETDHCWVPPDSLVY